MQKLNKILIDTNVLVYMYERKKDIFEFVEVVIPNAEFFVLDKTVEELEKVFKQKPLKLGQIKKYLKKLEEVKRIKTIIVQEELAQKNRTVDKLLIYYARDYIIYTNDKELKKKINERGKRVLILKENGVYLN